MVLIHGSGGTGAAMAPLADALRPFVETRSPTLLGHGGRPIPERHSIAAFATDLIEYLDREKIERTFIAGYSLGGYIALYLARHHPERLHGAIALASKYVFDANTVKHWKHIGNVERLRKIPRGAELERAHAPQDWTVIQGRNSRMYDDLGEKPALSDADLAAITVPVMLISSDRDPIVPWAETLALGKLIPGSHVAMFYGAAHPIEALPLLAIARTMSQWIEKVDAKK